MGTDKAILPFDNSTFLEHLVTVFRPRVAPVIVVLGHNAGKIAAALGSPAGVRIVVNRQYKTGQLSSLQAGIRALPAEAPAALVTLVDHPAVAETTVAMILDRYTAEQPLLIVPRYGERRGHPVLFSRAVLEEILALPPEASAKQVVHRHRDETLFLDVDDPGVLRDIDTPEDYAMLPR